jgi:hypothetical protein
MRPGSCNLAKRRKCNPPTAARLPRQACGLGLGVADCCCGLAPDGPSSREHALRPRRGVCARRRLRRDPPGGLVRANRRSSRGGPLAQERVAGRRKTGCRNGCPWCRAWCRKKSNVCAGRTCPRRRSAKRHGEPEDGEPDDAPTPHRSLPHAAVAALGCRRVCDRVLVRPCSACSVWPVGLGAGGARGDFGPRTSPAGSNAQTMQTRTEQPRLPKRGDAGRGARRARRSRTTAPPI